MTIRIRHATAADADAVASVISRSFQTVADQFGINIENAPTHASNATPEWIRKDISTGVSYLLAEREGTPVACVAYRLSSPDTVEAQRLAVLPEHRGGVLAGLLNRSVFAAAREAGASRIRISIVADHHALCRWYKRMGFVETERRSFGHLPFEVQYLECALGRQE